MLKSLSLKNFVLVESCYLEFTSGFTVLTGETGAGKSTLLHALKLLLGAKFDPSLLRLGEKKGFVQGEFSLTPALKTLLIEMDIPSEDSCLSLLREISSDGRSRCFIQDSPVPLSSLQKVSALLFQIVDQHSYLELKSQDKQRAILDNFAALNSDVSLFTKTLRDLQVLEEQEKVLLQLESQKERELDFCLAQELELKQFSLQEDEEETLFQEYSLGAKSQEITEKTDRLFALLQGDSTAILPKIYEGKRLVRSLSSEHSIFEETERLLNQASVLLEEGGHLLRQALSSFDIDSNRMIFLEERLHKISKMKKKYGATIQEWEQHLQMLQEKIQAFENLEEEKERIQSEKQDLTTSLSERGKQLSSKRKTAALELSSLLMQELQDLNMGQAHVEIRVESQPRSLSGEDVVLFCLAANKGEAIANVKEASSGGELSRLLLALKVSLAKKNLTPTLIFDEIDANVGGETARMIGEKLVALSSHRQVLCITHFPQVARLADLHFLVEKQEVDERTLTTITPLDTSNRNLELLRMLGLKNSPIDAIPFTR